MKNVTCRMNDTMIRDFVCYLTKEEKSPATIEKYQRDVRAFYKYLNVDKTVDKEITIAYQQELIKAYSPASVNSMLVSINRFLGFVGWNDCQVKGLKIQRRAFAEPEYELSRAEYQRLLEAAKNTKKEQLSLVMETICATGIRVSELEFITLEAARIGRAVVNCKGKRRVIFLPAKLTKKLLRFANQQKVSSGYIFRTRKGTPMNRTRIWEAMKSLCQAAGVPREKVFPHNLRHLFARCYYQLEKDIVHLADILGHSDVNTTRIYTRESVLVHERQIARLGLII